SPVLTAEGQPMIVEVPLDMRSVRVNIWQANVGRVKLYLLDTNVEGNSLSERNLSVRLYAGDQEIRLQQQIIIGIGGVRVLRALGIEPVIWHANEGYAAFMMLERIRELVVKGLSFTEAADKVRATTVFTIHTLVLGVNDTFSSDRPD
ncbi:MAG: alpha-glucan phosphorylase, partial [Dehalococcoidia bacterium]|nr:alpha-glucan phosphorylase [Dehalococcoidia bacterium]